MENTFTPNTQITKFANNRSLMDIQDNINDQYRNSKGELVYSNKLILVVNDYQGVREGKHKEKFASYYLDMEDALYLAQHISQDTFKTQITNTYKGTSYPGVYMTYGGKKVSRVLSIKHQADKNRYEVKVGLYEPVTGQNGQTTPNWSKKIDEHTTYPSIEHMRKMFLMVDAYIRSALTARMLTPTTAKPAAPVHPESKAAKESTQKPSTFKVPETPQEPVIIDLSDDDLPF